jgi:hypothetical protein
MLTNDNRERLEFESIVWNSFPGRDKRHGAVDNVPAKAALKVGTPLIFAFGDNPLKEGLTP